MPNRPFFGARPSAKKANDGNPGYRKGRRIEWERKAAWERAGFTVSRSAGSHGLADLIAYGQEQAYFIQVKSTRFTGMVERLKREFIKTKKPTLPEGCRWVLEIRCWRDRHVYGVVLAGDGKTIIVDAPEMVEDGPELRRGTGNEPPPQ